MERQIVIDFTRGVLDRIRDHCGIENKCEDLIKIDDFLYKKIIFSKKDPELYFKIRPHKRLFYIKKNKDLFLGFFKNEVEMKKMIDNFVRQI